MSAGQDFDVTSQLAGPPPTGLEMLDDDIIL
jgi:hypothetical protein